jgi:hypothetical protein
MVVLVVAGLIGASSGNKPTMPSPNGWERYGLSRPISPKPLAGLSHTVKFQAFTQPTPIIRQIQRTGAASKSLTLSTRAAQHPSGRTVVRQVSEQRLHGHSVRYATTHVRHS